MADDFALLLLRHLFKIFETAKPFLTFDYHDLVVHLDMGLRIHVLVDGYCLKFCLSLQIKALNKSWVIFGNLVTSLKGRSSIQTSILLDQIKIAVSNLVTN
jgi:hypothetical protein